MRLAELQTMADLTVGHVGSMQSEYQASGVPFLRSQNVLPHRIDLTDVQYIDREFHDRLRKSALKPGDVVMVRTGKPGTAAVVPEWLPVANCSDLVIAHPGPELDPYWLSYYINAAAQNFISANLVGAVQQHFNVGSAKRILIPVISLQAQRAIAEVLGALDDKIAASMAALAKLRQLRAAAFEQAARLPGARELPVSEVVARKRLSWKYQKEQLVDNGNYPVVGQTPIGLLGYVSDVEPISASESRPVVVFGDHTCALHLVSEDFVCGPNAIPFDGNDVSTIVLYCGLDGLQASEEYKRHWSSLLVKEVRLPSIDASDQFTLNWSFSLQFERVRAKENQHLSKLRDTLLPHLMSGRITVREAEKQVEEAV